MSFESLGLAPELLRAVADRGYTQPTPIQEQAIPVVLQGRDVMGAAQTGTGKTAGFTLPLLQRLIHHQNVSVSPARHPVRALFLTPTRELAVQVYESVREYGKHLSLRAAVVYGGVATEPQTAELRRGVELLVATPGRLLDHVEQKSVAFNQVEVLVLDEADRMLDMGFLPDIKRIIELLPKRRQNLLFSATFPDEIRRLCSGLLTDPVVLQVAARNAAAETVTHLAHPVATENKRALLAYLIRSKDLSQVLVFVATKQGAGRLARQLQRDGLSAESIHGDKTQQQREEALEGFKSGAIRVLVATDVAARGLDIEDLPHVVNFELPHNPEDYVHRIGRTGRAGKSGDAISLVCPAENERLLRIERLIKRDIPRQAVAGFEPEPGRDVPQSKGARASRSSGDRREKRTAEEHKKRSKATSGKAREPGFDFTKPYEPSVPAPAGDEAQPSSKPAHGAHRRNAKKPLAALLGGTLKKAEVT
jgi:ATP-dependent RNA helicase RhlE